MTSGAEPTVVHLIYIHGFQGNDTTFQRFPTDLQSHLDDLTSTRSLKFRTKTSLYPTYKSAKPISYATKNFLEWLETTPPGPVILLGHSLGGLLAADAATDVSQRKHSGSKHPIIGMVAFDTPYLGMHPHVVISGIASLFNSKKEAGSKEDDDKGKSEKEMNPKVDVVDHEVTDEWEQFKGALAKPPHSRTDLYTSPSQSHSSLPLASPTSPSASQASLTTGYSSLQRSSSPSNFSKTLNALSTHLSPKVHSKVTNYVSNHAEDPLVKWALKHSSATAPSPTPTSHDLTSSSHSNKDKNKSNDTLSPPSKSKLVDSASAGVKAYKKHVIETFQFGSCMFDPSDLKDRYSRLVAWKWRGGWVNYWTITFTGGGSGSRVSTPKTEDKERHVMRNVGKGDRAKGDQATVGVDKPDNDRALIEIGMVDLPLLAEGAGASTSSASVDSLPSASTNHTQDPWVYVTNDGDRAKGNPGSSNVATPTYSDNPPPYSPFPPSSSQPSISNPPTPTASPRPPCPPLHPSSSSSQSLHPHSPSPSAHSRPPSLSPSPSRSPSPPHSHHFIVLPTGLGSILGGSKHWEQVLIEGVAGDEVAAHTGLFIRESNWRYEELVERVGGKVVEFIGKAGV